MILGRIASKARHGADSVGREESLGELSALGCSEGDDGVYGV